MRREIRDGKTDPSCSSITRRFRKTHYFPECSRFDLRRRICLKALQQPAEQVNVRLLIITIALSAFGTIAAGAQLSPSDQAAVERYRSAIKSAELGSSYRGIEAAFSALVSVREALMRVRDGHTTALESLTNEEFTRLGRELPGVLLNRNEVVFVELDPDYFVKLAATRGDGADRAFFAALKATYPKSVWPVYIDQQTDYGGCTRFGSMSLVETYRAWSGFRQKYPDRYADGAKKEIDAVLASLTESTCACGDRAGVERELERFRLSFPTSPARDGVARRLQALRGGRSDIRTSCVAG